jgi:acyl-CoA thioesterase FadM
MFPIIRAAKEMIRVRGMPPLDDPTDTHITHHICWPHDVDMFLELNNGRALTLLDIGRFGLAARIGLIAAMRRRGWGLTMAGSSVRYRRRIRPFDRFEVHSRALCFDARFFYLEQASWRPDGECANHVLYRSAVTDRSGLVAPAVVMAEMGSDAPSPPIPDWVAAWCEADTLRPWPPVQIAEPDTAAPAA